MNRPFFIAGLFFVFSCNTTPADKQAAASTTNMLSEVGNNASCVYLTTDEKNNLVVSWCETDGNDHQLMKYAYFDTIAGKFSQANIIPIEPNTALHEEGMPKIAFKSDGTMYALYETSNPTKENQWAGRVRYIYSEDKGKTWIAPRSVHQDTTAGTSHSFAAITRLNNGEMGVTWLDQTFDYRKGGRPVKLARTNGGTDFTNEVLVDSLACECCRIGITVSPSNEINIVYRDVAKDSVRDIAISTSLNNGESFSPPKTFSADDWRINGCPHNGPSLAANANATYAVWFTGNTNSGVFYGELDDKKALVQKKRMAAAGRNIQLCLLPDGARIVVYSEQIRKGDSLFSQIVVKKIDQHNITEKIITADGAHAAYPAIARSGKDDLIVAWTDNHQVYYQRLQSSGITKPAANVDDALNMNLHARISGTAIQKDPVCGMAIAENVNDTTTISGKTIGFCSPACKQRFIKNPDQYLARVK